MPTTKQLINEVEQFREEIESLIDNGYRRYTFVVDASDEQEFRFDLQRLNARYCRYEYETGCVVCYGPRGLCSKMVLVQGGRWSRTETAIEPIQWPYLN